MPGLLAWAQAGGYSPQLVERVGVANRCLQLAAQQTATMTLRYRRGTGLDAEAADPQWIANPDPAWFPNGIVDAVFAATWSQYQHGDAFLLATSRYADGYPRSFTVLDAITMRVGSVNGRRTYESNGAELDADDVLQVSRDPRGGLRGTGALQSYAANLSAAYAQDRYSADVLTSGGVPWVALQPARRVTGDQAQELQAQWMARASERLGAPAVIPPDIAVHQFAWSPSDLLLLDSRAFEAAVICGAFGVPPPLVGVPMDQSGLTYTNTTDLFEIYWRSELYPAAHRLASALSTWLPRGNAVEFDPSAILAPSLPAKIDVATKAVASELMTPDEARAYVFDLPPLTQGEAIEEIDEPAGANMGAPADGGGGLVAVPRDDLGAA